MSTAPDPYTEAPTDAGPRLRAAREAKQLSLRKIADATKISIGTLEAVEAHDAAQLPGGIFTRAFVRAYAAEVGLDPERTLRDFMAQVPITSTRDPTYGDPGDDGVVRSDSDRVLNWVLICVAVIALVFLLWI